MSNQIFKNRELEINKDNIFANDVLDRKEAIEDLSSLIENTSSPLVMSVNASWGAGKTTFVKMWQAYLEKEKDIRSIYFSAWEDDFSNDPLISILGELERYISKEESLSESVKNQALELVKTGGKIVLKTLPTVLKSLTAGIVDKEPLNNILQTFVENAGNELVETYQQNKDLTNQFKETLQGIIENIGKAKQLVIFIDELDRCRPLYAIELLERIKHFFDIDGIVFVLSIDKAQLSETIKSQYGNIDTDNYLRRFIDLEYNLSNPSLDRFCDFLYTKIFNINQIIKHKSIDTSSDNLIIKYLIIENRLSLREAEQFYLRLSIIYKSIQQAISPIHTTLIPMLLILKLKFEDLYKELLDGKEIAEKIIETVASSRVAQLHNSYLDTMKLYIKAIVFVLSKSDGVLEDERARFNKNKEEIASEDFQIYDIAFYNYCGYNYRLKQAVNTIIKIIELQDRFNFDL